jgi:hypothetical protein
MLFLGTECATQSEYRDLLSEYSLLKEVCHRNVIKLLGTCGRDGKYKQDSLQITRIHK